MGPERSLRTLRSRSLRKWLGATLLAGFTGTGALVGAAPHAEALGLTPVATTGGASSVTASGATLSATVNPRGTATSVHFEYGTSTSFGVSSASKSAGSGLAQVSVSIPVSGLSPRTTYYFRVVATNAGGTVKGAESPPHSFTTWSPPVVSTDGSSNISTSSATVSGSVNPYGQDTTAHFEYGMTTDYGSATADTDVGSAKAASPISAPLTGLSPGTTYHFRMVASNTFGATHGDDQSFTTTSPPIVQTGGPTEVSSDQATVSGSVNPFGQDTSVHFEYGTTSVYGSSTDTLDVGSGNDPLVLAAPIGGLSPHTAYHYRIVAANASGTTYGADSTLTTSAASPAGSSSPGRTGSPSSTRSAHSTPIVISTGTVTITRSASASTSATVSAHSSRSTAAPTPTTSAGAGITLDVGQTTGGGLPGGFAGDIATKPHNRNPLIAWLLLGLAVAGLATVGVQMVHDRRAEH